MTDKQILEFYNKLVEFRGGTVPHPEHHPLQFAHLVKMYKYYMENKNE